jgi:putative SOS response-associated peptidase YedK
MCGRFTLRAPAHAIEEAFGLFEGLSPDLPRRFNIAPTQTVLALRHSEGAMAPAYCSLRWGLIPSWAKEKTIAHRLINARSEGIETTPSFRTAFKRRRCLILADGFYEWQATADTKPKSKTPKQPFHIHFPDQRPFAFAGLWEQWLKEETPLETCTIITTTANQTLQSLHDRMPVILDRADYMRWLNPDPQDATVLLELLHPCPDDWLVRESANPIVNNPRNEGPECLSEKTETEEANEGLLW